MKVTQNILRRTDIPITQRDAIIASGAVYHIYDIPREITKQPTLVLFDGVGDPLYMPAKISSDNPNLLETSVKEIQEHLKLIVDEII